MSDIAALWDNRLIQVLVTIILATVVQLALHTLIDQIVHRALWSHYRHNAADERKRERTLISIFHTLSGLVISIIAFVTILTELHVNIPGLLASAGLVGVILSISAQSFIKDILAGVNIILENQYRVGDVVRLSAGLPNGVTGVVEEITIRMTKLRDDDGNVQIIANGAAGVVTNMTFDYANINLNIPVSYDTDVTLIEKLVNQVGTELAHEPTFRKVIIDPIQFLRIEQFNDNYMLVKTIGKVMAGSQWEITGELRKRLLSVLQEYNIMIPHASMIDKPARDTKRSTNK